MLMKLISSLICQLGDRCHFSHRMQQELTIMDLIMKDIRMLWQKIAISKTVGCWDWYQCCKQQRKITDQIRLHRLFAPSTQRWSRKEAWGSPRLYTGHCQTDRHYLAFQRVYNFLLHPYCHQLSVTCVCLFVCLYLQYDKDSLCMYLHWKE